MSKPKPGVENEASARAPEKPSEGAASQTHLVVAGKPARRLLSIETDPRTDLLGFMKRFRQEYLNASVPSGVVYIEPPSTNIRWYSNGVYWLITATALSWE